MPTPELKDTLHISSSGSLFLPVAVGVQDCSSELLPAKSPHCTGVSSFPHGRSLSWSPFQPTSLLPAGLGDLLHLLSQAVSGRQRSGHPLLSPGIFAVPGACGCPGKVSQMEPQGHRVPQSLLRTCSISDHSVGVPLDSRPLGGGYFKTPLQ